MENMAKPRILVVEDDDLILTIQKWRLANLGYEVCGSAASGADAITCAAEQHPDLVLMDITLKGEMDGIETAAQMKKEFGIPVVFISSHTDKETLLRVRSVRPEGFIKKPFDDDDLRIAIELGLR